MTADEVVLAGGLFGTNNESAYYYLNKGGESSTGTYGWWTMTPSFFEVNANSKYAEVFNVGSNGELHGVYVTYSFYVVRPVISLKSSVLVIGGNGSTSTPYQVSL